MKVVDLAKKGYEFRQRSTNRFGACVTLCHAGKLVDIFYAASTRLAMKAAHERATTDFAMRRLS